MYTKARTTYSTQYVQRDEINWVESAVTHIRESSFVFILGLRRDSNPTLPLTGRLCDQQHLVSHTRNKSSCLKYISIRNNRAPIISVRRQKNHDMWNIFLLDHLPLCLFPRFQVHINKILI